MWSAEKQEAMSPQKPLYKGQQLAPSPAVEASCVPTWRMPDLTGQHSLA